MCSVVAASNLFGKDFNGVPCYQALYENTVTYNDRINYDCEHLVVVDAKGGGTAAMSNHPESICVIC